MDPLFQLEIEIGEHTKHHFLPRFDLLEFDALNAVSRSIEAHQPGPAGGASLSQDELV